MRDSIVILAIVAASCSAPPDPVVGSDAGSDRVDTGGHADARRADDGTPDMGGATDEGLGTTDISPGIDMDGCAALQPADCLADDSCTLLESCVEATGNEEPFQYDLGGLWDATVHSEGDRGLPSGDLEGSLSLFRTDPRGLRGVLVLPDEAVHHTVWGGVGPTGALGLFLGPPECDDATLCDASFAPAYSASGMAGEGELELQSIVADPAIVDFKTFVSLHATPSDGFKPVNPVTSRQDPFAASWMGDVLAVDSSGTPLRLGCSIDVAGSRGSYDLRAFSCDDDDADPPLLRDADGTSLAYADGKAWLALGTGDDDLVLVGRVANDTPWSGIVARRGDVMAGDTLPVDPVDVPVEQIRGTFDFAGLAP